MTANISSCNITNILHDNVYINNHNNIFFLKNCLTCSLIFEKKLATVPLDTIELNTNEISLYDKLYLCCSELDLRTNSKTTLCVNCFEMVNIINRFIRKYYTSKAFSNENFPVTFPSIEDYNFQIKEIKEEELDVSEIGNSTNMLHVNKAFYHTPHQCSHYKEIKLINNIRSKPFKCSKSNYSDIRKFSLNKDNCIHTGKNFMCDYSSSQKAEVKNHLHNYTGEKPFKCSNCGYSSSWRSHLIVHLRTHTGEKPFKCSYCEYSGSRKHHLVDHIRTHTGEKPFKCSYCDYSSSQKGRLIGHLRIHTGEKPFKCSSCNYSCSQKHHLIDHLRIHTGEKPFKCSNCEHNSKSKSDLLRHIRTHSDEKPFKCLHCNYSASQKRLLIIHLHNHTSKKPFKCSYCRYSCKSKSDLLRHIRTH